MKPLYRVRVIKKVSKSNFGQSFEVLQADLLGDAGQDVEDEVLLVDLDVWPVEEGAKVVDVSLHLGLNGDAQVGLLQLVELCNKQAGCLKITFRFETALNLSGSVWKSPGLRYRGHRFDSQCKVFAALVNAKLPHSIVFPSFLKRFKS